jgi:heme exporter protein D
MRDIVNVVVLTVSPIQKKKNTLSGTEFQRTKEAQAAIMRQKQEAGEWRTRTVFY